MRVQAKTSPSHKMNPLKTNNLAPPPSSIRAAVPLFDHEKLHAYQQELRFITWVTPLIEEAKKMTAGKTREVCDQLDRASLSALLNTAEGNGKRQGQVRAKFFDDARVVSMLCGLVDRFDETAACRCREDSVEYRFESRVPFPEERKRMRKRKNPVV